MPMILRKTALKVYSNLKRELKESTELLMASSPLHCKVLFMKPEE